MSGEHPNGRAAIDRIVQDAIKSGDARTEPEIRRVKELATEAARGHGRQQK